MARQHAETSRWDRTLMRTRRRLFAAIPAIAMAVPAVAATQMFTIGLNQVVSDGVPAAGAGNIEGPGAIDIYTFTAGPGTQVFFDEISTTNCNVTWTLQDPSMAVIFNQQLG